MSLTLDEALHALPVLSSAQVVAGHGGLQRAIRWTHIIDNVEVLSWVRPGDLLLTTAFALKDNPNSEMVMIEELASKGIAGMLVSIGRYIREIPADTISAADRLGFPIVTIPWEVPLVEVTHAIHERIIGEQYELTEQLYHIHKVLSQLVLEGGGLDALAKRLSELLLCSVTIEDHAFRLQAYASQERTDEARLNSIRTGFTSKEIIDHLAASGLLDDLKSDSKPLRVPPAPALGLTLERIIAPILVGDELYGYIWVIAGAHGLNELDFLAIERAAHIAALILSHDRAVFAAEQRIKARLVENLMDPHGVHNPIDLHQVLQQFGLHAGYRVVILEPPSATQNRMAQVVKLAEQIMTDCNLPGAALEWGQRLLLILSSTHDPDPVETAKILIERSSAIGIQLTAGLSAPTEEASRVRDSYHEAMQALQTGAALGKSGKVWCFDRLGYLPWLSSLPLEMRMKNPYLNCIGAIARHDQENGSAFIETLQTYLDHGLNAAETAQALFIHRNTLLKRLNRMQELWAFDFDDPYFILNVHIALKDWQLNR